MKKGITTPVTFIAVILLFGIGLFSYYYFSTGGDFFIILCNKNREALEKAVSIYSVGNNIDDVQGVVDDKKIEVLKEYFNQGIDNPSCKLGGEYFITKSGQIFCTLHGFGDRIPKDKNDFLPYPEEVVEKEKIVVKHKKQIEFEKMINKPIELSSEDETLFIEGSAFEKDGKYSEAIGKYLQAIKLNPDELKYYKALSEDYLIIGKHEQAKKYAEYVLTKDPKYNSMKKIVSYVENKKYFDLRLRRMVDKDIRIAYFSYSVEKEMGHFGVMDINGDNNKYILKNLKYGEYAVGNNNNEFFIAERDNIHIIDMKTGQKRKIFNNSGYRIFQMRYSSLSRVLVFSSLKQSMGYEIYKINRDGSELQSLTQNSVDDFAFDFSPNGKKIVYVSGSYSKQDIDLVDVNGTNRKTVERSVVREDTPDWAPTRNSIAYSSFKTQRSSSGNPQRDIFIYDVAKDESIDITNTKDIDELYPNWSNKNDKIAFAAVDLEGYFDVYIMTPEGKNIRKITDLEQKYTAGWDYYPEFSWSADDNFIVFSAGFPNQRKIFITEVESGRSLRLTSNYNDNINPIILENNSSNNTTLDLLNGN